MRVTTLTLATLAFGLAATRAHAGGFLERKSGQIVTAALAPSIDKFYGGAHELAGDLDKRLESRLDQAGDLGAALLDRANHGLEARLLQIDTTADKLLGDALGGLDEISRARVAQISQAGQGLIKSLDKTAQDALAKSDEVLQKRIDQIGAVVTDAIRDVDGALEARIEQVDETLGRRLGSVDVLVTRQRLGLERSLVRVALLVGLGVFLLVLVGRLWKLRAAREESPKPAAGSGPLRRRLISAALATGGALGVVTILYVAYETLPLGAAANLKETVARNRGAFDDSLAALDFTRARFYASQLESLEPENAAAHRARAAKADLFRAAFGRPTALAVPEGRAVLEARLQAYAAQVAGRPDPDLLVLRAFLLWQTGALRSDEHAAASLCARALRIAPNGFALAPLAHNYIRSFLHAPYLPADVAIGRRAESVPDLEAVLNATSAGRPDSPLAAFARYDELVRKLELESGTAYLALLDAHAALDDQSDAPAKRAAEAQKVIEAWRQFDQALQTLPVLTSSPSVLAVFSLNDAVVTRALYYLEHPNDKTSAPLLAAAPSCADETSVVAKTKKPARAPLDLAARARLAPPRVAFHRRYAAVLGPRARALLAAQETARFRELECATASFERAYVAVKRGGASASVEQRLTAARRAAELGLFIGPPGKRVPLALQFIAKDEVGPTATSAHASAPTGRVAVSPPPALSLTHIEEALSQRTRTLQ